MRLPHIASLAALALSAAIATVLADNGPAAVPAAASNPPAAAPAPAGEAPKFAVIDPQIVLDGMQEMKDIKNQFQQKQQQQQADENSKKAAVAQLDSSRKQLRPGSKQYNEISEQIDQATADLQSWETLTRLRDEREQKQTLLTLYKEIQDACGRIAQQDGLDLVITTIDQDIPSVENMTNDQLHLLLDERVVMFHSARVDITQKVLIQVNLEYAQRQAGGSGGAPAGH
ncbi:MAG TPA: OmpH family outer membrane protein [Tepidisphaeraceae bacterium]|nr:OmpH family outer membrane protein [Tepidisphaeraceae bacterium]